LFKVLAVSRLGSPVSNVDYHSAVLSLSPCLDSISDYPSFNQKPSRQPAIPIRPLHHSIPFHPIPFPSLSTSFRHSSHSQSVYSSLVPPRPALSPSHEPFALHDHHHHHTITPSTHPLLPPQKASHRPSQTTPFPSASLNPLEGPSPSAPQAPKPSITICLCRGSTLKARC